MNMHVSESATYLIPPPFGRLLGRLPAKPGSWLFSRALSAVLGPQLPLDVRTQLEGRPLRLRVTDACVQFDFRWQGGRFIALPAGGQPDLTIGACVHDLVRLARREEDPDTLFFARRLQLEGDTELGLLFKNTLDSLELPAWATPR